MRIWASARAHRPHPARVDEHPAPARRGRVPGRVRPRPGARLHPRDEPGSSTRAACAPIVAMDPARTLVLDLSVGSPLVVGRSRRQRRARADARIARAMTRRAARTWRSAATVNRGSSIRRRCSRRDRTASAARFISAWICSRPPGTAVHAPLPGVVHAASDNAAPLDYGPVIILKHETDQLDPFYTLYGHLTRESLEVNPVGRRVARRRAIRGDRRRRRERRMDAAPALPADRGAARSGRGLSRRVPRVATPDLAGVLAGPETVPARARCVVPERDLRRRRRGGRTAPADRRQRHARLSRSGAGRSRLDAVPLRRQRAALSRRVQQRPARRPQPPARRPRGGGTDGRPQHEHAVPARRPRAAGRASCRHAPRSAERLLFRQLRKRSQRARAPARARAHGPARSHRARFRVSRQHDDAHRHQSVQVRGPWRRAAPRRGCTRFRCRTSFAANSKGPRPGPQYAGARDRRHRTPAVRGGRRLCGFIAESCPSVGGQIVLPAGYLANVYARVRAAGGVCIADEVQTAYGRMGTHFYALRGPGRRARHRRAREADRQRVSARGRRHDAGDRGVVRQRHGVLQHVRRQHGVVRGRAGGARRGAGRTAAGARAARRAHSSSTGCDRCRPATRSSGTSAARACSSASSSSPAAARWSPRPPKPRSSSIACGKRGF